MNYAERYAPKPLIECISKSHRIRPLLGQGPRGPRIKVEIDTGGMH